MSRRDLKEAPFALRFVRRREGKAAIIYRRRPSPESPDRLGRVATISPLALLAGSQLVHSATKNVSNGKTHVSGASPVDLDWGARLAVYGRITSGLRDAERMSRAAGAVLRASGSEAAWWLGMIERDRGSRVVRALRVLTEATA